MGNYGDDLFATIAPLAARRFWGAPNACSVSPRLIGVDRGLFGVSRLVPASLYRARHPLGRAVRFGSLVAASCGCDLLVMAGGSLVSSQSSSMLRWIQRLGAGSGRVPLAGIGISVGPFRSSRHRDDAARCLSSFAYLSVRDGRSYELLKTMALPRSPVLAGDLAGLWPLLRTPGVRDDRVSAPMLGVSLCNYERFVIGGDREAEVRRERILTRAVCKVAKARALQVRVLVLNNHPTMGDVAISTRFSRALAEEGVRHEVIGLDGGAPEIWRAIEQCSGVLTVRLHGAITAHLCDVPFVLVEYHEKCSNYLDDISQPQPLRVPGSVGDEALVVDAVEHMLTHRSHPGVSRQEMIARSLLNFEAAPWYSTES